MLVLSCLLDIGRLLDNERHSTHTSATTLPLSHGGLGLGVSRRSAAEMSYDLGALDNERR